MQAIIEERLIEFRAEKQYKKLIKKYKDKRVILYGAGEFFEIYKKTFDLSQFNIIAVTDKNFSDIQEPVFDDSLGYNVISPYYLHKLKPEIVLISA